MTERGYTESLSTKTSVQNYSGCFGGGPFFGSELLRKGSFWASVIV